LKNFHQVYEHKAKIKVWSVAVIAEISCLHMKHRLSMMTVLSWYSVLIVIVYWGGLMPNKRANGLIDLSGLDLDPAIQSTLSNGQRRMADRALPKKERSAKAREKAKSAARKDKRIMLDLDPAIIRDLKELSDNPLPKRHNSRTTTSQLAALAIVLFLEDVESGKIDLEDYLSPIQNPRYTHTVKWDKSPYAEKQ
jgi:hypothetical protein